MQKLLRYYKEHTGEAALDMHKVAKFAAQMGWDLPEPRSPIDALAERFAQAARDEMRKDEGTGRPYRGYHAIPSVPGQGMLWIDIDEASRKPMLKSLVLRREQMVGDGLQLTLDADHWNGIHPEDEPIVMPMDLTDDIEWRKNSPD